MTFSQCPIPLDEELGELHGEDNGGEHEGGHPVSASRQMLCSFFLCLLGGQLVMHFTNMVHLPYTPIMFVVGIILGTIESISDMNII
jgi:hypothetical protein